MTADKVGRAGALPGLRHGFRGRGSRRASPARGRAVRRGLALLLAALAVLVVVAPAALAVEEATPAGGAEAEHVTYEELEQQASQRAREFFPDPYTEPSFFRWLSIPNLIGGLVIALALLGAYLWWQPRFAAERREKQRR